MPIATAYNPRHGRAHVQFAQPSSLRTGWEASASEPNANPPSSAEITDTASGVFGNVCRSVYWGAWGRRLTAGLGETGDPAELWLKAAGEGVGIEGEVEVAKGPEIVTPPELVRVELMF